MYRAIGADGRVISDRAIQMAAFHNDVDIMGFREPLGLFHSSVEIGSFVVFDEHGEFFQIRRDDINMFAELAHFGFGFRLQQPVTGTSNHDRV